MAFASAGAFISESRKVSSESSWTGTTDYAISSGDLIILILGNDNNYTGSAGESTDTVSVTVDGNSMTKFKEYSTGGSGFTGTDCGIWYIDNCPAVSAGSNVVVTYTDVTTAKAIVGWRFTRDNSKTLTLENHAFNSASGADCPSVSLSSLTSREYLFIRGDSCEDKVTTFTATTSWTAFDHTDCNTTGGATAANQGVRGEFYITTATGATSSCSISSSSGDHAAILLALYEAGGSSGIDGERGTSRGVYRGAYRGGF